jgi:hypothetical protein
MGYTEAEKSRLYEQIPAASEDRSMGISPAKMSIDRITPLLSLRVQRIDRRPKIRIKAQNNKG